MIKRELYLKQIRPFIGKDIIKIITGLRRSGKSVLLEQICSEINVPKRSIYLNFESKKNSSLTEPDLLYDYVLDKIGNSNEKWYLFFDEIQEVQGWEQTINSFRVDFNADIYITGSNAKLLSGELATLISGRYVQLVVYPLSYKEFVELNSDKSFDDYLKTGGMPFLNNIIDDRNAINIYLEDLFDSVVLKDVVMRNNIRDVDLLSRIIFYVLANIGATFSATSIAKYFKNEHRKVSTDTVLNYVKYCEEAYLLYKLKRQDIQGKQILNIAEKYYIADHGIREAVYGNNLKNIEKLLENLVCLELLRRGYAVTVGTIGEKEVDFIGVKHTEKLYIQVTYIMPDSKTQEREFGNLRKIADNHPKFVVSMDGVNMSQDGIKHFHIQDFLLSDLY
ncbi:MAG: ATP-binding protein [Coriobacteriales bacterium]|jgi:predicted AAA+ superfamily ATPase|nr:ATP-binding protein [Coriobacteriales bacterium]